MQKDAAPKPAKKKRKPRKLALYSLLKKGGMNRGLVHYAIRFSKKEDKLHANDICNARMMNYSYDGGDVKEIVMDVKEAPNRKIGKRDAAEFLSYLHYILNDSPWAKCFITKNVSTARRYGVKFNLDMSVSQLMGAAIALREGWEYSWKLPLFTELLKNYPPNVAFLVASYLRPNAKGYSPDGFASSHSCMSKQMEWTKVKKFFKDGYPQTDKPIQTTRSNTYAVFDNIASILPAYDRGTLANTFEIAAPPITRGEGFATYKQYSKQHGIMLADWLVKELA